MNSHQSRRPMRSKWLTPPLLDPQMDAYDDEYNRIAFIQEQSTSDQPPTRQFRLAEPYSCQMDYFTSDEKSVGMDAASGFFFESQEDLQRRLGPKWPGLRRKKSQEEQPTTSQRLMPSYRYSVDGDEVVDMVQLKKMTPRVFERAVDLRADKGRGRVDERAASSRGSGSGGYLTDGFLDDLSSGLEPNLPLLRAFLYCLGRDELFAGLWSLDLADQIEFVDSISEADLVIHRRPRPGEKQFSYQDLLRQARERGVPFASINEPSKKELRASLLPVFELYAGRLPLFEFDQEVKKKGPKRIRL